ncbi:MAG: STAS domain-containing protein [Agarilytica sp.]
MGTCVDFQLPDNLTIANVHGLHEQLEALVEEEENDKIVIQAGGVTRADTAGIQLLLAFVNSAKEHQISLDWDHPSDKLLTAASVLGLENALGMH